MGEVLAKRPAASIGWVHIDAQRWALTQMARTDITPLAKLVLFAMAAHVRDDRYEVWPSQERLASLVGATRQGVRLAIDSLEAASLLDVTKSDGLRVPHAYRLRCEESIQRCKDGAISDVNAVSTKETTTSEVHRTSTARARQQSFDDASEAILGFPIDGPGGPVWPMRQAFLDELSELFPKLDILSECRAALAWVRADASRRKTAKGMRAFLTGWVTRSNDRPRPAASMNGRVPTAAQTLKRRIDASGGDDYLAEAMRMGGGDGE